MRGAVVTLEQFTKQLRRDMTANPKKAAALGLMVLVALYFWGPLVWKWANASGNNRANKANVAALILTDDPAEPTQQNKARGGMKFRWEKVRQLIQEDPLMVSATFDKTWTEPFGKSAAINVAETPAEQKLENVAVAAPETVHEPEDLNIVLNGIFVGAKTRVATINGQPCYEGELVTLADKETTGNTYEVRVARIQRQSVVLEMNGKAFSLELGSPKLARGDEIERTKANGN